MTTPLPPGWAQFVTPDGKAYYANQATGVTQWEPPTGAEGVPPLAATASVGVANKIDEATSARRTAIAYLIIAMIIGVAIFLAYWFGVRPLLDDNNTQPPAPTGSENSTNAPTGIYFDEGTNADAYGIRFVYEDFSSVPTAFKTALDNARTKIQTIVVYNASDGEIQLPPDATLCGNDIYPAGDNKFVKNLDIWVSVGPIDGVNGILGQSTPCDYIISGTLIPVTGMMTFDVADVDAMAANGVLEDTVRHEMLHVFGIGTYFFDAEESVEFDVPQLISNRSLGSVYIGQYGVEGFNMIGGSPGDKPRVEDGPYSNGTDYAHWRELDFQNELMTGFINTPSNPLSKMTVSALRDLGYVVNVSNADSYSYPPPSPSPSGRLLRGSHGRDTAADATQMVFDIHKGNSVKRLDPSKLKRVHKVKRRDVREG